MAEKTFDKIARKTGRKISFCKCNLCKQQCTTPCLGTPEDIEKIIDAGFEHKIFPTDWWAGVVAGSTDRPIFMFQPELVQETGYCTFFKDGLCTLHDLGLKPTEGKLSHHSTKLDNFKFNKSLSWMIAKEWQDEKNKETIHRIMDKLHYD
jgi:hypothetical protein